MIKVGAAIVLLTVVSAILAPWAVPYDPSGQELALRLERPSLEHPFGLDELGRDIFSRVLAGARISLFVGLTVVGISSVLGVLLGSVAGYFGGWLDDIISGDRRKLAFPGSSRFALVAGLAHLRMSSWPSGDGWGVTHASCEGKAESARARVRAGSAPLGAGTCEYGFVTSRTTARGMVQATLGWPVRFSRKRRSLSRSGVQPPTPSWGNMLNGGRLHLLDAPHLTIFPGAAIAVLVLGFNFLGDGLRDAVDPKRYRA